MFKAVVAVKNAVRVEPHLESAVFTFWLGPCADKHEAQKTFEKLCFCLPDRAFVIYEETK